MSLPRVMLVEDHASVAEGLHKLLKGHVDVVATVSDRRALLETAQQLRPDVIIVDIGMPLMNGPEAGLQLKEFMPAAKLIYLTMNEDPDLGLEAMRCHASAYLLKSSVGSELICAIQMVLKGKSYVTPRIAAAMQETFVTDPRPQRKRLTPRQREIVRLLTVGKTMKEAARVLKLAPRTIAFHKYRIMRLLGLHTTADLIQFAMKSRILVP